MTEANAVPASAEEAFRDDALRWLPNVARYARLLTRNAADADDLTQETFLRAYQSWTTFRPGSDCRKWLFTICRNLYLSNRRRAGRVVELGDPDADIGRVSELYWSAVDAGVDDLFDRIDVGPALERGLADLAPEYREVLVLVDVESYAYADAASVLGVPVGTIRSRLFRARRLLQEVMIEYARDMGLGAGRARVSHGDAEDA